HGLWERTALTPDALEQIRGVQQEARDRAAVARAQLRSEAATEETRLKAVTEAGARVARVQAETAATLAEAWSTLEQARDGEDTARALTCVTERVTPASQPRWELPVWGPVEAVPAIEAPSVLNDEDLDRIVEELRDGERPPMSYRDMAADFRAAGHSAGETRLRASWRRVTAQQGEAA
ncbi:protein spdB, partial [Dactylosporangium matsuzakiense]